VQLLWRLGTAGPPAVSGAAGASPSRSCKLFSLDPVLTRSLAQETPAVHGFLLAQTEFSNVTYALFCTLHFLEFAIWGAWFVVLGNLLDSRGFSRKEIGLVYGTMPIGSIISPMLVGMVADRYFSTQVVIGVLHLAGAGLLWAMATTKGPRSFFWIALAYALAYSPTLALVNSIVFAHVSDAERYFPLIRVFGTIGWIVAGLSHKLILKPGQPVNERPLLLAAGLSLLLGLFSFALPDTPPRGGELFEFSAILGLVGELPIFLAVSLIIAMAMSFYFAFAALFVEKQAGVQPHNVGPLMTIGQWVEIIFMLSLPWFLGQLGMNTVLAMGVAAWALRFGLFATGGPLPLIILGIGLHGICFDFFFAAGFIHVDAQASDAIRNSAQTLYGMLVYGLGMYLGAATSGWLNQQCTREETTPAGVVRVTNWRKFWLIPCVVVTVSLLLLLASQQVSGADRETARASAVGVDGSFPLELHNADDGPRADQTLWPLTTSRGAGRLLHW
jgi:nucleoside transporter